MSAVKSLFVLCAVGLVSLVPAWSQQLPTSSDPYRAWAIQQWGAAVVNDSIQEATVWGQNADPDHDGHSNLYEYALGTDPKQPNADPVTYDYGKVTAPGYLTLNYSQRANDAALVVFPQYSNDLQTWWPVPPRDAFSWEGDSTYFWNTTTGAVGSNGLQSVSRTCAEPLAAFSTAFSRVLVMRSGSMAVGSPFDALTFFDSVAGSGGSSVDSNTVVLTGFAGTITFSVSGGAHLIVNGVDVGTTANVTAGSTLRIRTTSPTVTGSPVSYNLSVGGAITKAWTVVTRTAPAPTINVPPGVSSTASGYTPVSASVSATGAASIGIPITAPPGAGGLEPKMAIAYSSQGGNGLLGVGFGISGLSVITRVGGTTFHDGFKGAVSFGPNDRFALDGQRLILASGIWGADNTGYRTELESFSQVTSLGSTNAGPQSWKVKTKAGLTYEYGSSVDSRILANRAAVPSDTAVLVWALTRITDNAGNSMEFSYYPMDGTENGCPRISRVAYTKNASAGVPALSQVVFSYEDRPDVRISYIGGARVEVRKRLKYFDCMYGAEVSRHYGLTYQPDPITDDSKLTNVQEWAGNGDAMPATVFDWAASASSKFLDTSVNAGFGVYRDAYPFGYPLDFNGDGRADYLDYTSTGFFSLFLSNGTGFDPAVATNIALYVPSYDPPILPGDYNGDGKADLLVYNNASSHNQYDLRFSTGAGFGAAVPTGIVPTADQNHPMLTGDFNGDGRTDLLVWSTSPTPHYNLYLSNGSGFNTPITTNIVSAGTGGIELQYTGDYNGDGLTDLLVWDPTPKHYNIYYSTGAGFSAPQATNVNSYFSNYQGNISGDFNGDGLTDLLVWNSTLLVNNKYKYQLYLCNGNGFEAPITTNIEGGSDGATTKYFEGVDFNGDGKADVMTWHEPAEDYKFHIYISTGTGFKEAVTTTVNRDDHFNEVGDFDGDGKTDMLVYHSPVQYTMNLFTNVGPAPMLVAKVINGHGGYTKFDYLPLTKSSGYTKGTTAVYPCYDLQAPLYVVSTLTSRNGADGDPFTGQGGATANESAVNYHYTGAWACLDGRGFRGFAAIDASNAKTGLVSHTEYETADPDYTGQVKRDTQSLLSNGHLISESVNTWKKKEFFFPGQSNGQARTYRSYFAYTDQSISKSYEINDPVGSAPVKTTTVSGAVYDDYGNLAQSLTDYGGGFTEATVSIYTNDTSHWWLGRLTDTVVTQQSPGPVTATRHSTFQYLPTNGQLTRETIVTPESNLQLQKDYVHDAFGNIKQSTLTDLGTGATRTTTTTYTPDGRFINQTTNALNQTESKTYDPFNGAVLTQTGPNGLETVWTYDGFGRSTTETRPDGTQTYTRYLRCAPGNGVPPRAVHCVLSQSSGGSPSAVYFDILDRKIREDATGFDGSAVSTHAVFDEKGQVVKASLPFFSSASASTAPAAQYTTNFYDLVGRVIEQDVPGAANETGPRKTTTAYAGLTATVTNPKSQTFQATTDLRGRTVSSTSFGTDTVTNTHDPYGNLVQVSDGHSHLTSLTYDGRGNKIRMVEPNSGTTTYGYNAFGELTSQTDALGRTTTMAYDKLGRMVRRIEPDAPAVIGGAQAAGLPIETDWVYEYGPDAKLNPNGVGKLGYVWRQSDGYLESYRYDGLGRLTETLTQVGAMQFVTTTTFDEYSRPDTLSYPTGFAVRNHYNAYGHLDYVCDAGTPTFKYWVATSVNARGQVVQERLGNNVTTIRGYDPYTGLLQTIQTGKDGVNVNTLDAAMVAGEPAITRGRKSKAKRHAAPVVDAVPPTTDGTLSPSTQNLAYTFDNLNNLTQRRDLFRGITENFTYDATNQLSGTTCSAANDVTITCDHLGNITSRSDVGTYTYGQNGAGPHAVTSITGANGQLSRTLTYNAVGNCVQDGDTKLSYNATNQPAAVQAATGSILFSYTPGRGRLKRSELAAGKLTNRVYIGSLYERDDGPGGVVHTHFIPAGGGVVAIRTQNQTGSGTTSQVRYVHKDHLGSVQTLTDENGNVVDTLSYDAWGRRRTLTFDQTTQSLRYSYTDANGKAVTDGQTDRGFTGHEMLDAVGLIHMNGRIYDPTIGRFLSMDPLVQEANSLQNLNRYAYVLNNPLSMTDPSGFSFLKHIGKFFSKNWKSIVAIAAGVITAGAFLYAGALFAGELGAWSASGGFFGAIFSSNLTVVGGIIAGAGGGFGSSFTGSLLTGGSLGDAFQAGLAAAAWGAASGGAFTEIDHVSPSWLKTYDVNKPMFSLDRIETQLERFGLRATTSAGIAHLRGGKTDTAFWRSISWDAVSLAQDVLMESQRRVEWAAPNHRGLNDPNQGLTDTEQGFGTAQGSAGAKPPIGVAVINGNINNWGQPVPYGPHLPFGTFDLHEGSGISNFMAFDFPGQNQISLYHDYFITAAEIYGNSAITQVLNLGSTLPYAAFTYGRWGNEFRERTGYRPSR